MEKEFIPYEQSFELKELGFNEPCMAFYEPNNKEVMVVGEPQRYNDPSLLRLKDFCAPLYQQAFRWLRHKHNCVCEIIRKEDGNHSEFIGWVYIDGRKIDVVSYWDSKSYEETELACLNKLIEIIKIK